MSVVYVGKHHVDALLSAAAYWGAGFDEPFEWEWEPLMDGMWETKWIDAGQGWRSRLLPGFMNAVGQGLIDVNALAWNDRYPNDPVAYERYEYEQQLGVPPAELILKAVRSFGYQCEDLRGWKDSEAYAFLRRLQLRAEEMVVGYHEADWVIGGPNAFLQHTRKMRQLKAEGRLDGMPVRT